LSCTEEQQLSKNISFDQSRVIFTLKEYYGSVDIILKTGIFITL